MNNLFKQWQWKLTITLLTMFFILLPVISSSGIGLATIIFCILGPISIWLTLTYSLEQYGTQIKSRYSIKDVNPDFYQTIKVTSDNIESTPLASNSIEGPSHIGIIEFINVQVQFIMTSIQEVNFQQLRHGSTETQILFILDLYI
jgi:hypothetical protein